MIRRKITGCIVLISIILQACSLLTVDVPLDKAAGRQVFENTDSAVAAITGIYEGIASTTNFFCGGASVYAGIYTDELVYTGLSVPIVEFSNSTLTSGNTTLETIFWNNSYYFIYRANACIEGLTASQAMDAPLRDQLMGEAKFLRALLYFHLIHYFDEVPLITSTDQSINERMPRTQLAKVKEVILSDLRDARQLLSPAYPTSERARVNKWCAAALLARFYLYENNWVQAEEEATAVINSGLYRLVSPDSVFLVSSKEAILQVQPVIKRYHTLDGLLFIPSGNMRPGFTLTSSLMKAFEAGDKRKANWIATKNLNGVSYAYPFKYKKRLDASADVKPSEYTVLLRLAELYLIRAECNAIMDQLPAAISNIDVVRRRAGLPLIANTHAGTGINAAELLEVIQRERRTEYFAELGHRWMDLKRTGKIDSVMTPLKKGWKSTGAFWPIPAAQIALNSFLVQNPGYY